MTDFESRFCTYLKREQRGLDTHRDDIGTLQERKNKILIIIGQRGSVYSKEYYSKEYASTFLIKREILLTLLEDGGITFTDFDSRCKALIAQHNLDAQQQLSGPFNNILHASTEHSKTKRKLKDQLNKIRIKRLEERLENE